MKTTLRLLIMLFLPMIFCAAFAQQNQPLPEIAEIYPIANYGAVEIGYHRFINKAEGNHVSRPGKFIIIWQKINNAWKITRVVSLH